MALLHHLLLHTQFQQRNIMDLLHHLLTMVHPMHLLFLQLLRQQIMDLHCLLLLLHCHHQDLPHHLPQSH